MGDSVDIEAFRKLKPSHNSSRPDPFQPRPSSSTEAPVKPFNRPEVSPPRNLSEIDPILKAWNEAAATVDENSSVTSRKGPASFRIPDEYMDRLAKLPGRGVGSKIKYLLDYSTKSKKIFKDQLSPLVSILGQIDKEISHYSSAVSAISDLKGPDGARIFKLSKEASLIHQLISFDKELHGEHLSSHQLKTLSFALGLSRSSSNQ